MSSIDEMDAFEGASLSAQAIAVRPAPYMDDLNPAQRQAVEHLDGPVLMLAGTGKTKALTARIAHLLFTGKARPREILPVTFTNKAAHEMKDRVGRLLGQPTEGMPWLGTFLAIDVLVQLHAAPTLSLDSYGSALMTEYAAFSFTRCAQDVLGSHGSDAYARFEQRFADILHLETGGTRVVVQRDYHAVNLIWLPERQGLARVGLLDFQSAMLGHPAYDLKSLLQDVRRNVPAGIKMQMIDRYISATGVDGHDFRTAYAVGIQG